MKISQNYQVVVPAYGRDYKNATQASADFLSGKDFQLRSVQHGDGYCSIRDFESGVVVNVRYAKMSKVAVITVPCITLCWQ